MKNDLLRQEALQQAAYLKWRFQLTNKEISEKVVEMEVSGTLPTEGGSDERGN